jgi:acyl-CoA oxidase
LEVFNDAKHKGVFDRLNEAHAVTSGAKAILTNEALRGMEILRRAAGGHGFLMASGLPGVIQEFAPTPTYEGK